MEVHHLIENIARIERVNNKLSETERLRKHLMWGYGLGQPLRNRVPNLSYSGLILLNTYHQFLGMYYRMRPWIALKYYKGKYHEFIDELHHHAIHMNEMENHLRDLGRPDLIRKGF